MLHWQRVRALMSGGRMIKVQHKTLTLALTLTLSLALALTLTML